MQVTCQGESSFHDLSLPHSSECGQQLALLKQQQAAILPPSRPMSSSSSPVPGEPPRPPTTSLARPSPWPGQAECPGASPPETGLQLQQSGTGLQQQLGLQEERQPAAQAGLGLSSGDVVQPEGWRPPEAGFLLQPGFRRQQGEQERG